MTVLLCWLALPLLYAGAARLGRALGLLPIVSQLLLACLGLPLLALYGLPADGALSQAALVAPAWLELLYGLCFALLLGHILGDVIELEVSLPSLKIALPSFLVPFLCGLASAIWLLALDGWLARLALGLLFALSAIPILHLYLRSIGYAADASRRLLQSAILIDLACWGLFALAQGGGRPLMLLLTLLAALLPLALRRLGLRRPLGYSLPFFALMLAFQQLGGNALLFGIGYLLCLARLGLPLQLPLRPAHWQWLQQYLAIPLLLSYGILQVDFQQAVAGYSASHLLALVLLPIVSKLAGNWLGLRWAGGPGDAVGKWRESLLLNIRGLTEIVFLNLLLAQQVISPAVYFALLLMSLVSTLLPAIPGIAPRCIRQPQARSPYGAA